MESLGAQTPVSSQPRLDSLTGMRFAAAFVVFSFHLEGFFYFNTPFAAMTHAFIQGPAGVSFFFILSGFVLTWSHRSDDSTGAFYQRRLAKIGPLNVVTWGLMGLIVLAFAEHPGAGPSVALLVFLTPWIPQYSLHLAMNNPSWSLGCELFFYALFPWLLVGLKRLTMSQRRWAMAGVVFVVLCFAAAAAPDRAYTTSAWALYFFPPVRLVEFVLGMLLALELADDHLPRVSLLGASLLALVAYVADSWAPASARPVAVTIVPFSLLIVAAAQADIGRRKSWWRSPAMVRLGTWSFALYMVHWPVLSLISHFVHGRLGDWPSVALGIGCLVASVAAAALLYRFVEHPLEVRLRPRKRQVSPEASFATGDL